MCIQETMEQVEQVETFVDNSSSNRKRQANSPVDTDFTSKKLALNPSPPDLLDPVYL